ncbi:hypothetical protein [Arthrobacter sp. efr-133-R2A-63]|nr:hypothetical protein [Arthrobacter sp. efr-133-R2A-63]
MKLSVMSGGGAEMAAPVIIDFGAVAVAAIPPIGTMERPCFRKWTRASER